MFPSFHVDNDNDDTSVFVVWLWNSAKRNLVFDLKHPSANIYFSDSKSNATITKTDVFEMTKWEKMDYNFGDTPMSVGSMFFSHSFQIKSHQKYFDLKSFEYFYEKLLNSIEHTFVQEKFHKFIHFWMNDSVFWLVFIENK